MEKIRNFIGMNILRRFNCLCWASVVCWMVTGKGLLYSTKCGYCMGCFSGLERERYFAQEEIKRNFIYKGV
jgi:uncharacterized membrane protein